MAIWDKDLMQVNTDERRAQWRAALVALTTEIFHLKQQVDGHGVLDLDTIHAVLTNNVPNFQPGRLETQEYLQLVHHCSNRVGGIQMFEIDHAIEMSLVREWAMERRLTGLVCALRWTSRNSVASPGFPSSIIQEGERTYFFVSDDTAAVAAALEF